MALYMGCRSVCSVLSRCFVSMDRKFPASSLSKLLSTSLMLNADPPRSEPPSAGTTKKKASTAAHATGACTDEEYIIPKNLTTIPDVENQMPEL
mmetsp:Transcript_41340/g.76972  ORF Transcript_41340/g.76972 Transcript_41340/m.76972 type:complete len:94 (-) Transcript_41340:40-321(-)